MQTTSTRRAVALTLAGAAIWTSSGCERAPTVLEFSGGTMGTGYDVTVESAEPVRDSAALGDLVERELDRLDHVLSTYDPGSDVSRFGAVHGTDPVSVDSSLVAVTLYALDVARRSEGAFDPTVGALVDAWGFGPSDGPPPDSAVVDSLLRHVGYELLSVDAEAVTLAKSDPEVTLDVSGVAKGYAAELVAGRLSELGYVSALVEVGGELRALGTHLDGRPWRVAVEGPGEASPDILGTIDLVDEAIATSGDFRNFYEVEGVLYTHIVDPRTGYPVRYRGSSVSVVHTDGAMADAWATALSVLGPDEGYALAEREGLAAVFAVRGPEGVDVTTTTKMAGRIRPLD